MNLTRLLPEREEDEILDEKKTPRINLNVIVIAIAVIMIAVVIVLTVTVRNVIAENDKLQNQLEEERKIDVTYIGNKLESISELATARMTYNGMIHFEEGKIPLITKKEFYMSYRVSIKAGFEMAQAEIIVTDHTVTINLPEVTIYEPNVDEKSFQFFDQSFALFNQEAMDDLAQAISEAKADALAQPETEEMKVRAEEQAVALLTALLEGQIGERDLVINVG